LEDLSFLDEMEREKLVARKKKRGRQGYFEGAKGGRQGKREEEDG
jgi:hypothetical protein